MIDDGGDAWIFVGMDDNYRVVWRRD